MAEPHSSPTSAAFCSVPPSRRRSSRAGIKRTRSERLNPRSSNEREGAHPGDRPNRWEHLMASLERMTPVERHPVSSDTSRREVEISISIRTILLVAGVVALAWGLASIANVLLVILVSIFSVAVLLPVVNVIERRFGWSRSLASMVLVLGIFMVIAVVLLVLVQAVSGAVRDFSHDLPHIVDKVRHSDVGGFINGGSDPLGTLRNHASDITKGVGKASGGLAHVGASAFGAITLTLSVIFLTLFGLVEEPRARERIGSLMYRDKRER